MWQLYIIKSINKKYTYIGITNNIERRLHDHNNGYNKTTKPYFPFELIYTEKFDSGKEARQKEKYLKFGVGRNYIKQNIEN